MNLTHVTGPGVQFTLDDLKGRLDLIQGHPGPLNSSAALLLSIWSNKCLFGFTLFYVFLGLALACNALSCCPQCWHSM